MILSDEFDDLDVIEEVEASSPKDSSTFAVEESSWGYTIHSAIPRSKSLIVAQFVSWVGGILTIVLAFGLIARAFLSAAAPLDAFTVGPAVLLGSVAIYLFWYASRGTQPAFQVDIAKKEVREVVLNRVGRPAKTAVYPFSTIEDVYAVSEQENQVAQLVLWFKKSDDAVSIAQATPGQLVQLRERVAQDLV